MSACAVTNVVSQDAGFQRVKEYYSDKKYSDDHLAQLLQMCREHYGYDADWYPETPAQFGTLTKYIKYRAESDKLKKTSSNLDTAELYQLYTTLSSAFTPEQLSNRVNMICHRFYKIVNDISAKSKGFHSRMEIINSQKNGELTGVNAILKRIFDGYEAFYSNVDKRLDKWKSGYPDATESEIEERRSIFEEQRDKMNTVIVNKKRLAALAAAKIGEVEGFVVNARNGFELSFEETDNKEIVSPENDFADDDDGDYEERKKEERYYDYRTLHLTETLSVAARRFISNIEKIDSDGNVVTDDMGIKQYIDDKQVAIVLNRALVNSTPESLISDLEAESDFHPWMKGVVSKLNENPDYRTLVYNNFKKSETTYVYTSIENGKYIPRIANSRSAGHALMREAGTNISSGLQLDDNTSITNGDGTLKTVEEIAEIFKGLKELKNIVQSKDNGVAGINMVETNVPIDTSVMDEYLKSNPGVTTKIASYLRGIGFNVSAKDIRDIAMQTITEKGFKYISKYSGTKSNTGRNRLYRLLDYMSQIYSSAQNQKSRFATGRYLYNTNDRAFRGINNIISLSKYNDVESRVVVNGKSLSANNNTNLIHQVFDALSNKAMLSEDRYQEMLENEFLQYEGMSLGFGAKRQIHGWLKKLRDNDGGMRDMFHVVDQAQANGVEYEKLTTEQKLTNSLVMFLDGGSLYQNSSQFAAYEVPIQSDYSTAYQFVIAPHMTEDEVIDELTNEILIELERIWSIKERMSDDDRVKLSVYEKRGSQIQIFPEMNSNGFIDGYLEISSPEDAKQYVRNAVVEQLNNVISEDIQYIKDAGILSNKIISNTGKGNNFKSLYVEDGDTNKLSDEGRNILRWYSANVFYARQQITKLLDGGTEQFDGIIDFEKRAMLNHATRTSLYTNATWKGKQLEGRTTTQNVVYVADDVSQSAFLNELTDMLEVLRDKKVISEKQFKYMVGEYSKIKTTDGQGLRTLDSYRKLMIMSSQWSDRLELAYNRIKAGNPKKSDIQLFIQNKKPVYTGYERIEAANGEHQKPVRLTVLHKYAEMVLLPTELAKYCLQANSVPFKALAEANEQLAKKGKDVDMFIFHSGVKVGAHSIISPFAKWKDIKDADDRKAAGWNGQDLNERIISSIDAIRDYIVNEISLNPNTVHNLPLKYYGISSSTPEHAADEKIAWVAQAEKQVWANIGSRDKINVRGNNISATSARTLYNKIKAADIIIEAGKLSNIFTNSDELERLFQEELASKSYTAGDVRYALAHLKDGSFGIPLYSPNVEHQVQQLLTSIIRKRLTKPKKKGVAMLQTTSLGVDIEVSQFSETDSLPDGEKLGIVFEGSGENRRIKYVEVALPIHDSRLKQFTDENGNISAKRLQKLIDEKVIPESLLEFIAFRTPSDAEHSIIPCRIKCFTAPIEGATIRMPKEVMKMTGHDFDGDKIRCYFKQFNVSDEISENKLDIVKTVLGQQGVGSISKLVVDEYDYGKSPFDNSQEARDNARVELMFAKATSSFGSRMMIIPGGCEETSILAKTLYIIRSSRNDSDKVKIANSLIEQGLDESIAYKVVLDTKDLYHTLMSKSDEEVSDIIDVLVGGKSPFSVKHSNEAFESVMGGASMIGPYAVASSAFQMFQRLNLRYNPFLTKNGDKYDVDILGCHFDNLFQSIDKSGFLGSFTLGHLVNAAVDNNKNPILGYLNQTHENVGLTLLLAAAGMKEEHIHLIMNQPSMIELVNRMKKREHGTFVEEATLLTKEIAGNDENLGKIYPFVSLLKLKELKEDSYIENLASSFAEIRDGIDYEAKENQIHILNAMIHLYGTSEQLQTFVKLTRPEADSRAMGTSVASVVLKRKELNDFRESITEPGVHVGILGMENVIKATGVYAGMQHESALEQFGDELPEVVALNTYMMDNGLSMFDAFFPLAKDNWSEFASFILDRYYGIKEYQKEKMLHNICSEMILWKLLSDKRFVGGDSQEEQKRILVEVPRQLLELKEKIAKAESGNDRYKSISSLVGNAFLDKLTVWRPESENELPKIRFTINGSAIEGQRDLISASWGEMLFNDNEDIRKLAHDLFKYCMYTNGFSYGMYEFSHFAPFSLLYSVPGYMDALRNVINQGKSWAFGKNGELSEDAISFMHYYYMNHWGDERLVPGIYQPQLKEFEVLDDDSVLVKSVDNQAAGMLYSAPYVVVNTGEGFKTKMFYRVELVKNNQFVLIPAPKLGSMSSRGQQITFQYNPSVGYQNAQSVVVGSDSSWGVDFEISRYNFFGESNYNAPGADEQYARSEFSKETSFSKVVAMLEAGAKSQQMEKLEKSAEVATKHNEDILGNQPMLMGIGGLQMTDPSVLSAVSGAAIRSGIEDEYVNNSDSSNGKLYSISRIDENGKVVTDRVSQTPNNTRLARRQKVFVELNKRLREILREKGVSIGVLNEFEARLSINGVSDFDTATLTSEGLKELIRLREGYVGEEALPEEFAHLALAMLGSDNALVKRLTNVLMENDDALREAFEDQYDEYVKVYNDDREKLVIEAAGKLVAKNLLRQQEIQTSPIRSLVHRIVDAIKSLLGKFRRDEIQNAIFEANDISSKLARGMLNGELVDFMDLNNVSSSGEFFQAQKDLTGKEDILSKLLKTEVKRLSILKNRIKSAGLDPKKQSVLRATEIQIAKLKSAIENYKTEHAVVSYLNDSLSFIAEVEKSLDNAVNSGKGMNSICRKLNVVRDTLYSFASSMEAISDAIVDKEINDTADITDSLNNLAGVLSKFNNKYRILARSYFEAMLSNVYGEDGITIEIGRQRGRHISIHEMATKADSDISTMSRLFHAIADCDDYVLGAFDEITKSAKISARRRAEQIRPKIEVAMSNLIRETGSRDQSFMFEYKRGDDGKPHKTGKYISKEASKKLSKAQRAFYDTMMEIKAEMDKYLPESLVENDRIVMLRKYTYEKVISADGANEKKLALWDSIKNKVLETSDNVDSETYEVSVDFEGNRVDMLPVKFTQKSKNESYDDMTDDVAMSIMTYAGMATEYNELNNVIGILENAKYMAAERDVIQHSGDKEQRESIGYKKDGETDDEMPAYFRNKYTRKQALSNTQKALNDFFEMHVYGHIRKNEGSWRLPILGWRFSKRKTVDTINSITSWSQMALNIPQRINNIVTGKTNIYIETMSHNKSGRAFSAHDVAWASKIYMQETGDRLAETGKTDYDNKLSKWCEHFDIHQDNGRNGEKYSRRNMSRIFNQGIFYAGLRMGEDYLAATTSLALARNFKVKNASGKVETLWDAYEVKYLDKTNESGAYLALKDGYTKLDGSPITAKDEENFQNLVAGTNFELQGIYNTDDKSAIQQYAFGALIIMYRKWIAPSLRRRYAKTHYNIRKDKQEEGYYRTAFRFLWDSGKDAKDAITEEQSAKALINIMSDIKAYRNAIILNWSKMTDYEKSNVSRAAKELSIIIGLWISCALLGKIEPPDSDDGVVNKFLYWSEQQLLTSMLRLRSELSAVAPTPAMAGEVLHILKSPFAALEPINNTIHAFNILLPSSWIKEIRSGRYKGHSPAYKYFRELPVISMFKRIDNFVDPSPLIKYYQSDML